MLTTVEISRIDQHGKKALVYRGERFSIPAALRVVDGLAPAPVNRYVRRRIQADLGGQVRIGQVCAEIGVYA